MLSCEETSRLLSEARERRLGWRQRLALRLHLALCSGCRRFGRQLDLLGRAARRYVRGAADRED
ncbi:MAG: hypothetical protein KatS3mg121_1445 [Gammaproteobacteria bacterium]|nr:MAG: hypothetical protein KatS3mg121_1445 [Gammaproteobacteria bacterium]